MSPVSPERWRPSDEVHPIGAGDETSSAVPDEDARLFYERLEQTGQLVDVDTGTDLSTLPPQVTHIRHPDGTVERIGFTA
jgi:hypothetical protein